MIKRPHSTLARKRVVLFFQNHWQAIVGAISALLLLAMCAVFVLLALQNSLLFSGFAIDGAFQLYNPLRRLADGQVPGADFQFFHGVLIPLLHYPLYMLFGQDLAASELARWLLSPLAFLLSTGLFFWLLLRRWWSMLFLLALATIEAVLWIQGTVYPENSLLGLRSVGPVLVMAAMLYRKTLLRKYIRKFTVYELLLPALLVFSLLCGTEQGLGALIAFLIVECYMTRGWGLGMQLMDIGRKLLVFCVFLMTALTIVTFGHPFAPLQYAFGHVAGDQFWYFGTAPNDFVQYGRLGEQLTNPFLVQVWLLALLVALVLIRLRKQPWLRDKLPAFWFGWFAGLITGTVASLGYYAPSLFIPMARLLLLITLAVGALAMRFIKQNPQKQLRKPLLVISAAVIVLSIVSVRLYNVSLTIIEPIQLTRLATKTYQHFVTRTDHEELDIGWQSTMNRLMPIINKDNAVAIIEQGANNYTHGVDLQTNTILVERNHLAQLLQKGQVIYLKSSGRHRVAQAKPEGPFIALTLEKNNNVVNDDGYPNTAVIGEVFDKGNDKKLWSSYSALVEAEMGIFSPNHGYDYIIHALGPKARQQYLDDFDKTQPQFVLTTQPSYTPYVAWLEQRAWPFYSRVIDNYQLVAVTGSHMLWERTKQPWRTPDFAKDSLSLTVKNNQIKLPVNPTNEQKMISVTVDYHIAGLPSSIPGLQKLPRYLLKTNTSTVSNIDVSLPPYEKRWSFPIVLRPHSSGAQLDIRTISLVPGTSLHIDKATYQQRPLSAESYQGLIGGLEGPIKP